MDSMERRANQWPPISREAQQWMRDPDELALLPNSARRRMLPTYEASIPHLIANRDVILSPQLTARVSDLLVSIARFDGEQMQRGYDLPALLLRSESSASSQIEHLTSSVRNVALAELADESPQNARLVAGNVAAMRKALASQDEITVDSIRDVHRILINWSGESFGGELRREQVWVGGTPYSPHGAHYVPPTWQRVPEYLDDIVAFISREDVDPIVQAAVAHAQFETVHPFIDGNGRTGRVLLHKILRRSGVLLHVTLPLSAGLLHNVDAYMKSLEAYQEGNPIAVVEQLVDALELSLMVGRLATTYYDAPYSVGKKSFRNWYSKFLGYSNIREGIVYSMNIVAVRCMMETISPELGVQYAEKMGITTRAAQNLVSRACEYEILRPLGNRRRGVFYQADELIDVLEEASSLPSIRRMVGAVR